MEPTCAAKKIPPTRSGHERLQAVQYFRPRGLALALG
jgi:hypothetical protein